jgi:murein DD-endopeptidase MepM/ murein hydrolase activator NlpD
MGGDIMQLQHLPYTPLRITSGFGPRNTGIAGASTNHKGVDIGVDKSKPYTATDGGPVTAVLPGVVVDNSFNKLRGWVILIDHGIIDGKNVKSLYQHLKQAGTAKGTRVNAGDQIGTMGNTGVGAQLHLHFEIWISNVPVDPAPYLKNVKEEKTVEEKELTTQEAINIVQSEAGLDENTIQFLLCYKHGEALIKKLAVAMK